MTTSNSELLKILVKLGGSSLYSANKIIESIGNIIRLGNCKYIVVSAPGSDGDRAKVTDLLVSVWELVKENRPWQAKWDEVVSVFSEISLGLGVHDQMIDVLAETERLLMKNLYEDFVLHIGERLQGRMIALWLNSTGIKATLVDPTKCLFFKKDGSVDERRTHEAIRQICLFGSGYFIIPGYYGIGYDGKIKVFGRDGSDLTGVVFSAALSVAHEVDRYCMGKDVDGFLNANPAYVPEAEIISEASFDNARALAFGGSKVIHPKTLDYLTKHPIPVQIFNPNVLGNAGTLLKPSIKYDKPTFIGVAGKKHFIKFTLKKSMMNEEVGFIRKVTSVFENFGKEKRTLMSIFFNIIKKSSNSSKKQIGIAMDHIPTGIDTMTVLAYSGNFPDPKLISEHISELIEKIRDAVNPDSVDVVTDIAVLAGVCSESNKGLFARFLNALEKNNIRTFTEQNIDGQMIVSLDQSQLRFATQVIHREFFRNTATAPTKLLEDGCHKI